MMRLTIFLNLIFNLSFIYLNPITSNKSCLIKSDNDKLDLKMLKGKWFDLARTTSFYNKNTWKNGVVSIKNENNQIELVYSGLNSSNSCETSQSLLADNSEKSDMAKVTTSETIGRLQILTETESFIIVLLCYEDSVDSKACSVDKFDLFVWSKIATIPSIEFKEEIFSLLRNFCVENIEHILFRDSEKYCLENEFDLLTAELDIIFNRTVNEPESQIAFKRLIVTRPLVNQTTSTKTTGLILDSLFIAENETNVESENFSPLDQDESSGNVEETFSQMADLASVELEIKFKKEPINLNILLEKNKTHVDSMLTENQIVEFTTGHSTALETGSIHTTSSYEEEMDKIIEEIINSDDKMEDNNLKNNLKKDQNNDNDDDDDDDDEDDDPDLDKKQQHDLDDDKKMTKKEQIDDIDIDEDINENQIEKHEDSTPTQVVITTTAYPCQEINCPIANCNYGRKRDENGCDTCDCLPNLNMNECSPPYCHPCFYGSYTDENGCESCACKPRPKPKSIYECPKLDCPSCNYGSIKDEYGCETCICIRPNSPDRSYECPPEPTCPFGTCKYGSILNDYGCATCECLKSSDPNRDECVRQRCPSPCPHGYFTEADGCESCICKPDWMAPCYLSQTNCPNDCEFGTYLDRNGCPSCECLPNPNLKTKCEDFKFINSNTECDEDDDGIFKPKQCNDNECRCVSPDGFPISDFKANKTESDRMNCECALALYDASRYKAIGFKLYCSQNGNYETIQCVGASCACVNDHGDPLGPSVPIYQKHLLRCEGVYQRLYYEKYLTTIAPTTLVPPLCVFHREKALEMANIDRHLSIPECDERGEYLSVQCDRHKKYCWCVNTHNGIELYGTRKVGDQPNCSVNG